MESNQPHNDFETTRPGMDESSLEDQVDRDEETTLEAAGEKEIQEKLSKPSDFEEVESLFITKEHETKEEKEELANQLISKLSAYLVYHGAEEKSAAQYLLMRYGSHMDEPTKGVLKMMISKEEYFDKEKEQTINEAEQILDKEIEQKIHHIKMNIDTDLFGRSIQNLEDIDRAISGGRMLPLEYKVGGSDDRIERTIDKNFSSIYPRKDILQYIYNRYYDKVPIYIRFLAKSDLTDYLRFMRTRSTLEEEIARLEKNN